MSPRSRQGRSKSVVRSALVAIGLLVAGCGGPPTAQGPASTGDETQAAAGQDAASSLEDVYAAVEGLTGAERRQALIDLAAEEGSEITIYTTMNVEDIQPVLDRFTDETGVAVSLYRAPNQDVIRRVLQEETAGHADVADVISINDLEQAQLAREGILAPLETPATEGNAVVSDTWAGAYLAVYLAAWNTNVDRPPTTWEEVFTGYPGELAYQLGDFNWFATLVNDWYVEQRGMTEREAVDMIASGVAGSQVVDGHTLGAELLAAGEYTVASSLYHHTVVRLIEEGAPLAWEPVVNPLIVRSNGVGIHHRTPRPASALLLTEYMLTDMQEMLPEFGRTPAVEGVPGGLPAEYDPMPINLDLILDDQEKWDALHQEIITAIGGEPLVEE